MSHKKGYIAFWDFCKSVAEDFLATEKGKKLDIPVIREIVVFLYGAFVAFILVSVCLPAGYIVSKMDFNKREKMRIRFLKKVKKEVLFGLILICVAAGGLVASAGVVVVLAILFVLAVALVVGSKAYAKIVANIPESVKLFATIIFMAFLATVDFISDFVKEDIAPCEVGLKI